MAKLVCRLKSCGVEKETDTACFVEMGWGLGVVGLSTSVNESTSVVVLVAPSSHAMFEVALSFMTLASEPD